MLHTCCDARTGAPRVPCATTAPSANGSSRAIRNGENAATASVATPVASNPRLSVIPPDAGAVDVTAPPGIA